MHILAFDQTTLASRSDWSVLRPLLGQSVVQTLQMVLITIVVGGFLGLILGVILYGTRPGNLVREPVCVPHSRHSGEHHPPDPIHHLPRRHAAAHHQGDRHVDRHRGGDFPDVRDVHFRNLPSGRAEPRARRSRSDRSCAFDGCLEIHDHSHGADPRSLGTAHPRLCLPVHRRARHVGDGRYIGGGGLGNFAIAYGYQKFDQTVTWTAVIIMILLVQVVQSIANAIAKHLLRRTQNN